MDTSDRKRWLRTAILVGVLYFVIGFVFSALDRSAPDQLRFMWRLGAWVASAVMYAAHISYEHFRLNSSPRVTALHAAMAAAAGAFLLAVAATVHKSMVVSQAPYWRYLIALVAWPALIAIPAFVVALIAAAALALKRRRT